MMETVRLPAPLFTGRAKQTAAARQHCVAGRRAEEKYPQLKRRVDDQWKTLLLDRCAMRREQEAANILREKHKHKQGR
jgi:hypothetical protein